MCVSVCVCVCAFVCVRREKENKKIEKMDINEKGMGRKGKKEKGKKRDTYLRSDSAVFRNLTIDNSAVLELRAAGPHPRPVLSKRCNMRYIRIDER